MKQRTAEWFDAKRGKASASHGSDIMAKRTSAARVNYIMKLVCERLTGETAENYMSGPMQWGVDNEPFAITEYELKTENLVEAVGFFDHPSIPMFGASPDGLVGDDGMVEAKCPNTSTHIDTLLGKGIATGYMIQMQIGMDVKERAWCDFISYDPRLPDYLQLYVERVERDEDHIREIREAVISFLSDLEKLEAKLRAYTASSGDKNDTGSGNEEADTAGLSKAEIIDGAKFYPEDMS